MHQALCPKGPLTYVVGCDFRSDIRVFSGSTYHLALAGMRQGVAAEREGYTLCRMLVVMSKRSADYIARHYDVPECKIRIVPPGANIPERLLEKLENSPCRWRRPDRKSLVIGYIGLYPERKGLPTIAEAVQLLRTAGYDAELHVI